jgi:hypothetical protein
VTRLLVQVGEHRADTRVTTEDGRPIFAAGVEAVFEDVFVTPDRGGRRQRVVLVVRDAVIEDLRTGERWGAREVQA